MPDMKRRSGQPAAARPIPRDEERAYVLALVERIVRECPCRLAGTASERRAQRMLAGAFSGIGVETSLEPFRFSPEPYTSLALHFGLGTAGSLLYGASPAAAFVAHSLAGVSYLLEGTARRHLLRPLAGYADSRNLVAVVPAQGEPALRVVIVGHADAALGGIIFDPKFVERFSGPPLPVLGALLARPLRTAVVSQLALAGVDLVGLALGRRRALLWPLVALLSVPGLVALAVALEALARNEVVPGANDNITGCVALPVLASRLVPTKPANVELVLVATGAEESGWGGALALARRAKRDWDRRKTVVIAIDSLSGGELRWFEEGEMRRVRPPGWLEEVLRETAGSDPRFRALAPFDVRIGGTDAQPFASAGFDAVGLGCVDATIGAPRHYHQPTDTPENLDPDQIMLSIDIVERIVRAVIEKRVGRG
jgi:hypothetical protein